jgi:hypothetical protein
MKGRDRLGRFKKGVYQGYGFKKGFHPKTEFKGGYHPKTEFPKGHKLCCGEDNPMYNVHRYGEDAPRWIDGRSYTRRDLTYPKSF